MVVKGSYEDCKNKIIKNVMDEFKKGELKDKKGNIITNHKQALAISLSMVHNKCKRDKLDVHYFKEKLIKDLKDETLMTYSHLQDIMDYMGMTKDEKKKQKVKDILFNKIILNNNKIKENMWKLLYKINELI